MKIIHSTAKAYLVEDDIGKFWLPKLMCEEGDEDDIAFIYPGFIKEYIEKKPEPMEGDDLDLTPIVKKVKPIPKKKLIILSTPQGKDPLYEDWVKSNSKDTYAKWCSDRLPF